MQVAVKQLRGAYGTVVMDSRDDSRVVVARSGSPLVIGRGIGENFIASDQMALLPVTRRFIFLEEGDVAEVTRRDVHIFDTHGDAVVREELESELSHDAGDKGEYRHYMLKEIYEQPKAITNTLEGRLGTDHVEHVQIVACGTSYNSGMVARYWFEEIAGVSCDVEIASEFRYRKSVVRPNSLLVTLSQSGETADTLAALRLAKQSGYMSSLAICNLAGLLMLVASVGHCRGNLSAAAEADLVKALQALPLRIKESLALAKDIEALAEEFADKHHSLFLGRGSQYPIAMEGALKLKEISYIHAEAYAAGELKHGPLALIDAEMPIISDETMRVMSLNHVEEMIAPIVYTVPLQLLSYHVALIKGTDVDQPRNLAEIQLAVFLTLDWSPKVIDIREQFPLRVEDTVRLAETYGLPHSKFQGVPQVLSADFLVDFDDPTHPAMALQAKYSADLEKPEVIERLELERRYWEEKEISWAIVTEREISRTAFANIQWLYPAQAEEDIVLNDLERYYRLVPVRVPTPP
ncbi:UNVERIFIED_CONTAM: hypothetical protein K2H54_000095 [Gekko kuhli]